MTRLLSPSPFQIDLEALSLLSIKYMLSDPDAGIAGLMSALLGIVAFALRTLFGAGLFKWINETFQSRSS